MSGNAPMTRTPMSQPTAAGKDYYLGFNYVLDRQSVSNLVALAQTAVSLDAKSITICLTSNGGDPDQASYARQILSALPVPLYTHAIGAVQSAAVELFMSGTRRFASSGASFLFHQTTFNPSSPTLRADEMSGHVEGISHRDQHAIELLIAKTGLPVTKVSKWFKGQRLRDPKFALANNIVHEIRDLKFVPNSEFAQVAYKF